MAATRLVGLLAAALWLPHLGGIEQRRNDRRRSNAYGNPGLDQLGPPFAVPLFLIAHRILNVIATSDLYSEDEHMKSGQERLSSPIA